MVRWIVSVYLLVGVRALMTDPVDLARMPGWDIVIGAGNGVFLSTRPKNCETTRRWS